MTLRQTRIAFAALALAAFASNSILCRRALGTGSIDPASFTLVRLLSGALTLALLTRGRGSVGTGREAGPWAGAIALFLYAAAFSFAYVRLPAGVGALVLFAATQATMIGWGVYRGERPGGCETLGIGIALAGLVGLAAPGRTSPDALGVALMLGAGASWGSYSLLGRKADDPVASNARAFLWATVAAAVVAVLPVTPRIVTSAGVWLAVVSGSLASGVGYSLWYAVLPHLSRPRAAAIQLTVPVLAAVAGIVLLGEAPTLRLALAGLVILGGVALATLGRQDAPPWLGDTFHDRRDAP